MLCGRVNFLIEKYDGINDEHIINKINLILSVMPGYYVRCSHPRIPWTLHWLSIVILRHPVLSHNSIIVMHVHISRRLQCP